MNRYRLGSQSGQTVIEYLLLLIVVLAIFVGLLRQFNIGFKDWGDAYFGQYVPCLMESGEIPIIQGQGQNSDDCRESFELAQGKLKDIKYYENSSGSPPDSGSSGNSDGFNTDKGSGSEKIPIKRSDGNKGKSKDVADSEAEGDESSRSAGAGSISGLGTSSGRSFRVSRGRGRGLDESADEANSKTGNLQISSGNAGSNSRSSDVPLVRAEGFSGKLYKEEEELTPISSGGLFLQASVEKQAKPVLLKLDRRPAEQAVDADVSLGIGDYLRYLIIAAIAIAIIFLLGGQLLSISKGME